MIMYQLYGALSNEDQAKVFEKTPEGIRKVVFCTNIA
jgi:HrpA-like RNA helicase